MEIRLSKAGRRYNREWIFREADLTFKVPEKVVILGGNGSGKSTLLQVISGFLRPSEGTLTYHHNNQPIDEDKVHQYVAMATPYIEIFEDYTLLEAIRFHGKFKPFLPSQNAKEIAQLLELAKHQNKSVRHFSSGMKQRLRLGLAILSDTPVLLLDEPTSNFDAAAILWYQNMIEKYAQNRLVIVCSNHQKEEYAFCDREITLQSLKKA